MLIVTFVYATYFTQAIPADPDRFGLSARQPQLLAFELPGRDQR
jgi:hypothetical protein